MSKKPTKKTTAKPLSQAVAPAPVEPRAGPSFTRIRAFGVVAILLAGLIAVIVGLAIGKDDSKQADTGTPKDGATITVAGEYVCLPHKDTTGPQTQECAFGLKTDGGVYYALQFEDPATALGSIVTGDRLKVTGEFEEEESIYQSIGTLSVDEVKEL
jgi:hypothetical protein